MSIRFVRLQKKSGKRKPKKPKPKIDRQVVAIGRAASKDQEALGIQWNPRRGLLGLFDSIRALFL